MTSTSLSNAVSIVEIFVALSLNMIVSVALIQVNKYIYREYKFPNMSLTCLNFAATFLGLVVCNLLGMVKFTRVPIAKMLPMAISFCGFVVLTNYSLEFNSIGTYQCLKALTTPGIVIISTLFFKQTFSLKVKLTVIPVLLGAFFNSMYDLQINLKGTIIGLVGAIVTSLYQVWIGEKQKEFNLSPMQLLAYQAPLSALLLATIIPIFDPIYTDNGILDPENSLMQWLMIGLSGLCAFLVNTTIYWIIGITSPLTYNMSGNIKFCLIIIVGTILFKEKFKFEQFLSVATVLIGLILYSKFRMEEKAEANKLVAFSNLEEGKSLSGVGISVLGVGGGAGGASGEKSTTSPTKN